MLKSSPALRVLCASERITLGQIGDWGDRLWPILNAEMALYGVAQTGPTIFVSHGRTERPDVPFRHDYCIPVGPVAAVAYSGAFRITQLPAIDHATALIEGPFTADALAAAYRDCLAEIAVAGKAPTGESREIYHRWGSFDSPDNRVEIVVACG